VKLSLPDQRDATRLVLVRHVEPDGSVRGRCYGRFDVGLSESGRRHAEELGKALSPLGLEAIYGSGLRRALETAEAIAAPLGLSVQVDPALRELDFGEFEGRSYDELAAAEPLLYRAWMENPTAVRFPSGESYADLRARVLRLLAEVREHHRQSVIGIVAHGGVTRTVLADALGMPNDRIFDLEQDYGGVSVIDWFGEHAVVRVLNADLASERSR
jgi:alpha-ribazole phosphatase